MQPTSDDGEPDDMKPTTTKNHAFVVISYGDTAEERRSNIQRVPIPEGVSPGEFSTTLDRTVKAVHAAMRDAAKKEGGQSRILTQTASISA